MNLLPGSEKKWQTQEEKGLIQNLSIFNKSLFFYINGKNRYKGNMGNMGNVGNMGHIKDHTSGL